MAAITQAFCTGNSRYKAAEIYTPQGVVLHSIGTPQPDASVLWNYWNGNGSPYITHYVLDDEEILQCMPNNFKCWHVGSPGNSKWIGIEMCEPKQIRYTSGASFTISDVAAAQKFAAACYNNAVWLIAKLCSDYGWDPHRAILTHNEISTKLLSNTDHVDPEHLWNGLGMGYDLATLRRDVATTMAGKEPDVPPKDDPSPNAGEGSDMYRIRKAWRDAASQIGAFKNLDYAKAACKPGYAVYDSLGRQVYPFNKYAIRVTASALNVRRGPSTSYAIDQVIPRNGVYTVVDEQDGWGLLKAYETTRDGWISLKHTQRL